MFIGAARLNLFGRESQVVSWQSSNSLDIQTRWFAYRHSKYIDRIAGGEEDRPEW